MSKYDEIDSVLFDLFDLQAEYGDKVTQYTMDDVLATVVRTLCWEGDESFTPDNLLELLVDYKRMYEEHDE